MDVKTTVGFAMCGSFCTLQTVVDSLIEIKDTGVNIIPIMSEITYSTDTRFGKASEFIEKIEGICQNKIIHTISGAEPFGPKKLLDILIISPCTGNTLAKLANGVSDTPVTLAAKAHLRNSRPLVIAVSSNDALAANAKNIGTLLNNRHIYFVPFNQDDAYDKPCSLVADFSLSKNTLEYALNGEQLQPIIYVKK